MSNGPLDISRPSELELRWTRVFDAPRDLVFAALTEPDLVKRWLTGPPGITLPVCEIDFRVGGRFRYVWEMPDGTRMGMDGEYKEITPPAKIVHTELFDEDWTGGETLVTTTLTEEDGQTRMTTTVRYSSEAARDAASKTGMADGVAHSYALLDTLLAE